MGYPLTSVLQNEYRDFALYTVESRAIPNMIDGLKPSHRFYLYSSIQGKSKGFEKVSAVSGRVSEYGYNHGEASVGGAGALMAAPWNNNLCLVEGRGSFGSRMIQETGAHRYIYTKVSDNFNKYIQDIDLAPKHVDPEHAPPAFYIPIIPLVLINGTRGIATGFSCNILPRSLKSITQACRDYVNGKSLSQSLSDDVSFPGFRGTVTRNSDGAFVASGLFEKTSSTKIRITELPPNFDREKYVQHLYSLQDKNIITSHSDDCDNNGFNFEVRFKEKNLTDEKIRKHLKLDKSYTENINVIDWNNKLRAYTSTTQLIADFCDKRMEFLKARIEKRQKECHEDVSWLDVKARFVKAVIQEEIVFRGYKKDKLVDIISCKISCEKSEAEKLLNMNVHSFTEEMVTDLLNKKKNAEKELNFWLNTTEVEQFNLDLDRISS